MTEKIAAPPGSPESLLPVPTAVTRELNRKSLFPPLIFDPNQGEAGVFIFDLEPGAEFQTDQIELPLLYNGHPASWAVQLALSAQPLDFKEKGLLKLLSEFVYVPIQGDGSQPQMNCLRLQGVGLGHVVEILREHLFAGIYPDLRTTIVNPILATVANPFPYARDQLIPTLSNQNTRGDVDKKAWALPQQREPDLLDIAAGFMTGGNLNPPVFFPADRTVSYNHPNGSSRRINILRNNDGPGLVLTPAALTILIKDALLGAELPNGTILSLPILYQHVPKVGFWGDKQGEEHVRYGCDITADALHALAETARAIISQHSNIIHPPELIQALNLVHVLPRSPFGRLFGVTHSRDITPMREPYIPPPRSPEQPKPTSSSLAKTAPLRSQPPTEKQAPTLPPPMKPPAATSPPVPAPEPKAATHPPQPARPEVTPPSLPAKPKATAAAQPQPPAPVRTPDVPKPPPAAVSPTLPKAAPKTPAAPPPESPPPEPPKKKTLLEQVNSGEETPFTISFADLPTALQELLQKLPGLPPNMQFTPPQYEKKSNSITLQGTGTSTDAEEKNSLISLTIKITNGCIKIPKSSGLDGKTSAFLFFGPNVAGEVFTNVNRVLNQTNITGLSVSPEGLTLQRKKKE